MTNEMMNDSHFIKEFIIMYAVKIVFQINFKDRSLLWRFLMKFIDKFFEGEEIRIKSTIPHKILISKNKFDVS